MLIMKFLSSLSIILLVAVFFCSCKEEEPVRKFPEMSAAQKAAVEASLKKAKVEITPITLEECQKLAERIELASKNDNTYYFQELVDWDRIYLKATRDMDIDSVLKSEIEVGYSAATSQFSALFTIEKLELVETRLESNSILFRTRADGRINYMIVQLDRGKKNELKIVNVDNLGGGVSVIDALRSSIDPIVYALVENKKQRITPRSTAFDNAKRMAHLCNTGNADLAASLWYDIDESIRKERTFQKQWLTVTSKMTGARDPNSEFFKAIKNYKRLFPNDRALPFYNLDLYISQSEFEKAHGEIDKIEELTNDPYMDLNRGWLFVMEEKYVEAYNCAAKWASANPKDTEPWEMALVIGEKTQDNDFIIEALMELEDNLGVNCDKFLRQPQYANFNASFEGKMWASRR